jgi:thiosulfate/3-mercaptopyruvate sulfurtransferase
MPVDTLISAQELARYLTDPDWVIVDCRFSLQDPARGERDYLKGHIPGAVYAHLDRDLSAPVVAGETGRHPLPTADRAAEVLSRMGIDEKVQVVAYDDAGGSLAAVRLWWMLRWLGHAAAAVLDGGWQGWEKAGLPTREGRETLPARTFTPHPHPEMIVTAADVERIRQDPGWKLVDVRAAERYRGEIEPIDKIAGHIPGAINLPYQLNMKPDMTYKSPEELREIYSKAVGNAPADRTVLYCGSGVTSIHSLLAMKHAGFGEPKLYVGSWSEWIADGERPVSTGEKP